MTSAYKVDSTSDVSATVQDIVISNPEDTDTSLTRRIMRPLLVENIHNKSASVKLILMHQKRHTKKDPWHDAGAFSLATLKAGQEIRLDLSAGQVRRLYEALKDLYALTEDRVPQGKKQFIGLEAESTETTQPISEIVRELVEHSDVEFWKAINALKPDVLTAVALQNQYEQRSRVVEEFKAQLDAEKWNEPDWQVFFEANTWIFGHGLDYRFLSTVTGQPHYGGITLSGRGEQRGDFLMVTAADRQFTVLVDIKKPQTDLLTSKPYRNKVYGLSSELVGGIAQLQSNCRTWVIDGSRQEETSAYLAAENISTYDPKGILIIGNTNQLIDINQRATFELFRRNLHNPEILTYDELLARAEFLMNHALHTSGDSNAKAES